MSLMRSFCTSNRWPTPSACILSSMSSLADSFKLLSTSRTHNVRIPRELTCSSTTSSAKKWLLPLPRPPQTPLYRAGSSSGSKTGRVLIVSWPVLLSNNDAFHFENVDVLKRVVFVACHLQRQNLTEKA